jgi:hypothetical protein
VIAHDPWREMAEVLLIGPPSFLANIVLSLPSNPNSAMFIPLPSPVGRDQDQVTFLLTLSITGAPIALE